MALLGAFKFKKYRMFFIDNAMDDFENDRRNREYIYLET